MAFLANCLESIQIEPFMLIFTNHGHFLQAPDRAGCFGCRKREAGPDSGSGSGVSAAKLPTGFQNSNGGPHHPQQQQHLGAPVHHHSLPHHHGGFNGYGGFYGGWNLPHHPVSPASQPPPLAPPVQLGLASANK